MFLEWLPILFSVTRQNNTEIDKHSIDETNLLFIQIGCTTSEALDHPAPRGGGLGCRLGRRRGPCASRRGPHSDGQRVRARHRPHAVHRLRAVPPLDARVGVERVLRGWPAEGPAGVVGVGARSDRGQLAEESVVAQSRAGQGSRGDGGRLWEGVGAAVVRGGSGARVGREDQSLPIYVVAVVAPNYVDYYSMIVQTHVI